MIARPELGMVAALLAACASTAPHAATTGPTQPDAIVLYIGDDSPVRGVKADSALVDSLTRLGTVVKRALDQPPAVLAMGPLKYPDDLRRMGIQGRVVIRCIVGRDGLVEPGTIAVVSADDPGLVFAAREAVRSTRFRPGRDRGEAVRTLVYLPIDFKIRITAGRP